MQTIPLSSGWSFKERNLDRPLSDDGADALGWTPAQVPGCVHLDLMAAGKLPDPFVDMREKTSQWVGERDWWYRCKFDAPVPAAGETASLNFDGLDTFATVWLNGSQVAQTDNMFVPLAVDVTAGLRPQDNELLILFASALQTGHALERQHGQRAVWNGDASRVYVRKAQYHYGWDWGPTLLTAGVWRAASLRISRAAIADFHVQPHLNAARTASGVTVHVAATGAASGARVEMRDPDGAFVGAQNLTLKNGAGSAEIDVPNPRLWFPRGIGAQPLYTCQVELTGVDGAPADEREIRVGLRDVRLVQAPVAGEPGTSFTFEVNGIEVFCGGANWIPADSFTPRITPERYRRWLELAANANMRMIRVWGGGIYEEDVFYDLCDELGLLVWQDFLFACGLYPAHPEFVAGVRAEAEAAVRRLRHHPSLAIWAGNNEDYQIGESTGAYDPAFQGDFTQSAFPARELYERTLPEVVARIDPGRAYWPGSPYTPGGNSADQTVGDRHSWDVWHGVIADYQDYPRYEGRFVSEFGMASVPRRALIDRYIASADQTPRSETMDWHNKASGGPERIATYLTRNVADREPTDLDDYIYLSQFNQAEAMLHAFGGWRRRWGTPGARAVSGALVWQLNDCWPVTSWALADYDAAPKPAWYVTRQALAPLVVGIRRTDAKAEAWLVSDLTNDVAVSVEASVWKLDGALVRRATFDVLSEANATLPFKMDIGNLTSDEVLSLRLTRSGEVIGGAMAWREPYRALALPDPGLTVTRLGHDRLRLEVTRPAKGVWLSAPGEEIAWSDNMLDMAPEDSTEIHAPGLGERPVQARWLGATGWAEYVKGLPPGPGF